MARTAIPTEEQLETAQRLRVVVGRLSRLLRATEAGSQAELTPTGVGVLLSVDHAGPIRLAEIGEREGLNPTMLSRTLGGLVAAGLVERTADQTDRRSAWVGTTQAGREVAERIRRERTEAVLQAVDSLSQSDRAVITDALSSLEQLVASMSVGRR